MNRISTAELKRRLSEFLGQVKFNKESFIVTRRGRPVAQLCPYSGETPRHLGQVRGWLEDSDPFFAIMEGIVSHRQSHPPRSLEGGSS